MDQEQVHIDEVVKRVVEKAVQEVVDKSAPLIQSQVRPRNVYLKNDSDCEGFEHLTKEEVFDVRMAMKIIKWLVGFTTVLISAMAVLVGLVYADHYTIATMKENVTEIKISAAKTEENSAKTNGKVDNLERRIAYQKKNPLSIDDTP